MNNPLRIALLFATVNLLLAMIFPPYDYVSMASGNIPTFDGIYFVFAILLLRYTPARPLYQSGRHRPVAILSSAISGYNPALSGARSSSG